MRSPIIDYLDTIVEQTEHVDSGETADYIPELAQADPDRAAIALATVNGTVYASGDTDYAFSIQSMSKPFAYGLAIEDHGLEYVLDRVGVEPSGEAFNELSLDPATARPRNPMINAGAIATHALVDDSQQPRGERIADLYSRLTQRSIEIDEDLAASELASGHRNIGLAYLLRAQDRLEGEPEDAVEGYFRQCSALVTVRDLALMAVTLANGGIQPNSGERIFDRLTTRQVLSVMASCGMYDAAGDWFTSVGIPAKSGVAGGIIGVLPGQVGVAVFSPRLDSHGNSARGVEMMNHLSEDMGLHLMDAGRPSRTSLREFGTQVLDGEPTSVYVLQGDMVLSSIEALVHELVEHPPSEKSVLFDMSRVDEVAPVARRTAAAMASKLIEEGYKIILVDPESTVPDFADDQGREVQWWTPEKLHEAQHES